MIRLYLYHAENLLQTMTQEQRQFLLSLLCVTRRTRMEKLRMQEARDRSLVAGVFLQEAIYAYCRQENRPLPDPMEFTCREGGKPMLVGEELEFSLSHSGSWMAAAVGSSPVGMDIECFREPQKCLKIAERCFHPHEYEALCQCSAGEISARFARYWTMKEAYVKYTGEGLRRSLRTLEMLPEQRKTAADEGVQFWYPALPDGVCDSVCSSVCCAAGEKLGSFESIALPLQSRCLRS